MPMSKYKDYKAISFTVTEISYNIGTEAGQKFTADSILFLATEDCYVRINLPTALQILIPKNIAMGFGPSVYRIYVVRKTTNGTLDVWSEGINAHD